MDVTFDHDCTPMKCIGCGKQKCVDCNGFRHGVCFSCQCDSCQLLSNWECDCGAVWCYSCEFEKVCENCGGKTCKKSCRTCTEVCKTCETTGSCLFWGYCVTCYSTCGSCSEQLPHDSSASLHRCRGYCHRLICTKCYADYDGICDDKSMQRRTSRTLN